MSGPQSTMGTLVPTYLCISLYIYIYICIYVRARQKTMFIVYTILCDIMLYYVILYTILNHHDHHAFINFASHGSRLCYSTRGPTEYSVH